MQTLVLASSSPFRRQILDKLQLPYIAESPDIDESPFANESAEQLTARLAEAKARKLAEKHTDALIIGSDQVAVLGGKILGKPHTHENATAQLKGASSQAVCFYTGLSVLNSATNSVETEVVPFKVHFRQLTDSMIENYLQKEAPYNCAGSFKSEGLGIALFDKLEGEDPNTLIGLPLIRLVRLLERQGLHTL